MEVKQERSLVEQGRELAGLVARRVVERAHADISAGLPLGDRARVALTAFQEAFQEEGAASLARLVRPDASPAELQQALAAFAKLRAALGQASTPDRQRSLREAVNFQRHPDGSASVTIPEELSVAELIDRANEEAQSQEIRPAWERENPWWANNVGSEGVRATRGVTYQVTVHDSLTDMTSVQHARKLASMNRQKVPLEALLVAAMCVHLESQGTEDFLKDLFVRCGAPGFALGAYRGGFDIRDDCYGKGSPHLAVASCPAPRTP